MEISKAVFSEMVKASSRTYFFNIWKTVKGNPYAVLTQSRLEKEGEFEKNRITVFESDFEAFRDALERMISEFESAANPKEVEQ